MAFKKRTGGADANITRGLMPNFRIYLSHRRVTQSPAGEFVREFRDEPDMEAIENWPQLQALIYRKARPEKVKQTVLAAEPVWKGYRAFVLKHRRRDG